MNAVSAPRKGRHRVGILTSPLYQAGNIPLSNLIRVLSDVSEGISLVTGNEAFEHFRNDRRVRTHGIRFVPGRGAIPRMVKHLSIEVRTALALAIFSRDVDTWVFFIGGDTLPLPMLTAKAFGKRVILSLAGSSTMARESKKDPLARLAKMAVKVTCRVSDSIVIYSPNLVREWQLGGYQDKISIAHEHFVDFGVFKITKDLGSRRNLVGHMGRLSPEKGTLSLLEAIPLVLREIPGVRFVIAGEGSLSERVREYVEEKGLKEKVELQGWISHDELPSRLNELRLVVIPSRTEGLPNLMLEAMACGTPVLATPVGAIPDVVKDESTGFITPDGSPASIARSIVKALTSPKLEEIGRNARAFVEREFAVSRAVEEWRNAFASVLNSNHK